MYYCVGIGNADSSEKELQFEFYVELALLQT